MNLIIGASGETSAPKYQKALPEPEVDLPHPASAPEAKLVATAAQIQGWLEHDSPLVRTFAVEQISQRDEPELLAALTKVVADEDELVAIEAVSVLEAKKCVGAADAIAARFAEASGQLAAACASALGRLTPDRLMDAVTQRRRLDDEGFAAVATSMAIVGGEQTVTFLNKALNRAGVLAPERRGALYGAALLSGDAALAGRVIGVAIEDSKKDETEEGSAYPSRASFAVLAGMPTAYSRTTDGLEVFDHAREMLEQEILPELSEADRATLADAMKRKQAGEVLAALAPLLSREVPEARPSVEDEEAETELGTMPRRRRGLLEALVARAEAIGRLELKPAAIFVAAAAQAAMVVLAHDLSEATSPAMIAISKALEGDKSPEALAALDRAALADYFASKTDRDMRRVVSTLVREHFRRASTLRRFTKAIFSADHGPALLAAAVEVEEPQVHGQIARAAEEDREAAEKTIVELLDDREADPKVVTLALRIGEALRTERIALVLGRRFFALREQNRGLLARAMLRCADARLLPLLESRAFDDEAEEVAWVVLALAHDVERTEALDQAIERTLRDRVADDDEVRQLRVPLRCQVCGEVNGYTFQRAYVDVEAKDDLGDPAFVGDLVCKACGTEDQLAPTEAAARILTGHMLEFLQAAEMGAVDAPPLVSPAQTELSGVKMGLAAALRALAEQIEQSPEAIRPRLHRARVRLILERSGVAEDLEVALKADPASPEARALKATLLMRERKGEQAMALSAEAARALSAAEPPRLYDADSAERLLRTVEDYMVELELEDFDPPEDVDLTAARQRRADREAEAIARQEAQRQAMAQGGPGGPGGLPPMPAAPPAPARRPGKSKGKGKKGKRRK